VNAAVLTDFGSTVCKVTVVDLDAGVVVGHGEAPTFLGADVMEGHDAAYDAAIAHLSRRPEVVARLASSSAGGGLRMVVVGMVDDMTTAAGERAALNAGARLELVLHGRLTELDVKALDEADPEIVLFSGGTDGGQRELVLENARMLAAGSFAAHVIVACNRDVSQEVADVFAEQSKSAHVVANVMPRIGTVQLGEVREAILSIFLKHVIRGKKLSERSSFLESVVTATPDAAMSATRLLAHGTEHTPGVGDVVVVDVGGATTDVHSVAVETSAAPGRWLPLLPLAAEYRTVNADLGMRVGAEGTVTADLKWLSEQEDEFGAADWPSEGTRRANHQAWLPTELEDRRRDEELGVSCVTHALARHCGRQSWVIEKGSSSPHLVLSGADLRDVPLVVGTGGVLAHSEETSRVLSLGVQRAASTALSPENPSLRIDHDYILAAAGLLQTMDDDLALRILRRALGLASPSKDDEIHYATKSKEQ
jgi:uncharacterized protein (TIGR01319 family)